MSQTNSTKMTFSDVAGKLFPLMKPAIIELVKQYHADDWSLAVQMMKNLQLELLNVKKLLQQMSTGEVPPSTAVQELLDRLTALEGAQAQLKQELDEVKVSQLNT